MAEDGGTRPLLRLCVRIRTSRASRRASGEKRLGYTPPRTLRDIFSGAATAVRRHADGGVDHCREGGVGKYGHAAIKIRLRCSHASNSIKSPTETQNQPPHAVAPRCGRWYDTQSFDNLLNATVKHGKENGIGGRLGS